jgi:hypothetical protein
VHVLRPFDRAHAQHLPLGVLAPAAAGLLGKKKGISLSGAFPFRQIPKLF